MTNSSIDKYRLEEILHANSVIKVMIDDVKFDKIRNALVQVRNALSVYYVDRVENEENARKQKCTYNDNKKQESIL